MPDQGLPPESSAQAAQNYVNVGTGKITGISQHWINNQLSTAIVRTEFETELVLCGKLISA